MAGANGNSIEIGQSDQELVGSKKSTNIRKLAVIALILLLIIAVIALSIIVVRNNNKPNNGGDTPMPSPSIPTYNGITLQDYLYGRLSASGRSNASWASTNELIYKDIDENIVKLNVETGVSTIVANSSRERLIHETHEYEISPDGNFLLVATNYERIFRHSAVALYDIINLHTMQVHKLTVKGNHEHLLLAQWAPKGNAIIFVAANNIFYKPNATAIEIQLTNDGSHHIRNGISDWVYEEEVFASKDALWFSPDGSKLAFVRFNDESVEDMPIPVYGTPGSLAFQYPKQIVVSYPKPGTNNPDVTLYAVNLHELRPGNPVNMTVIPDPQTNRKSRDRIISVVKWLNNNTVFSINMNRVQNKADLQRCEISQSGKLSCHTFKSMESKTGWLDLFKAPHVNKNGSQIALILSQSQGSDGDFRHVTLMSTIDGKETPLTSGKYVVQQIYHWDYNTNLIFYSANTETETHYHHIYSVLALPNSTAKCLTCDISYDGVSQNFFAVTFNDNSSYAILSTEGPSVPRVDIYSWSVTNNEIEWKNVTEWETNPEARELIKAKVIPKIAYHTIELDSGFTAKVRLQLPPFADLSGATKYPMLVDVYAGPDSYHGVDRFELSYGSVLATNKSIIYAQINGRGSGLRGDRLMHEIYRKLGTVEVDDQIETARKLSEKLPYIDGKRVGIWGWSYGGYASAWALARDNSSVFACAVAVAPVTDWIYYDSIYTERYMGLPTPEDNLIGYNHARLSTVPELFRNKKFMLVHGTLDDNVHFQQSMALAKSLEEHDIQFRQITYPDENHGLYSVRQHLYHSLGNFFDDCFHLK